MGSLTKISRIPTEIPITRPINRGSYRSLWTENIIFKFRLILFARNTNFSRRARDDWRLSITEVSIILLRYSEVMDSTWVIRLPCQPPLLWEEDFLVNLISFMRINFRSFPAKWFYTWCHKSVDITNFPSWQHCELAGTTNPATRT